MIEIPIDLMRDDLPTAFVPKSRSPAGDEFEDDDEDEFEDEFDDEDDVEFEDDSLLET